MTVQTALVLLALGTAAQAATPATEIDDAFAHLYNFDFTAARRDLDKCIAQQPSDPLGYAINASTYLFTELDRLGILESEFFADDKRITDKKKLKPDDAAREAFYRSVTKSQSLAEIELKQKPGDETALFSMCLTLGETVDYMALIDKKQIASLVVNRRAYRYAKELIQEDPAFYDAYITTGVTEYILGNLPFFLRWLLKFDDVQGSKEQGVRNLEVVAAKGHYLKPLAKILLATAYLRDKRPRETQKILEELTLEYPANPLLKRELEKISIRRE
jgi:predicted Zn-dependent protease